MLHEMRPINIKTFFILLILVGAVCLTTGIDQYVHILVCHTFSHHHTDSNKDHSSDHSDEQHCPICQFFVGGHNQLIICDYCEVLIDPIPVLWGIPCDTIVFSATPVLGKISRAPPVV
jgi:hypothetical protein